MRVHHTLEPIYNESSRTLILGSLPSVKSREIGKYYGHKQNRFWKVLESIYDCEITDWKEFVLNNHLALWDVVESCEITGSSDSSIKNVIPNDIESLLSKTNITNIFLLGKEAYSLYYKYVYPKTKMEGTYLTSPSSANASINFQELCKAYSIIKTVTK